MTEGSIGQHQAIKLWGTTYW